MDVSVMRPVAVQGVSWRFDLCSGGLMAGKVRKFKYCVYIFKRENDSFNLEVDEGDDPWEKAELELPSGWEIEEVRCIE